VWRPLADEGLPDIAPGSLGQEDVHTGSSLVCVTNETTD